MKRMYEVNNRKPGNIIDHSYYSINRRKEQSFFPGNNIIKVLMILTLVIVSFAIVMSCISKTQAEESDDAVKQYKSIMINPGDSLWKIAVENADCHYSSIQEYIDELMFINNLHSDLINADEYLLIPYYVG